MKDKQVKASLLLYQGKTLSSFNLEEICVGRIIIIGEDQFVVNKFNKENYKIQVLRRDFMVPIPIGDGSKKEVIRVGDYEFSNSSLQEGHLKEVGMENYRKETKGFDKYDRRLIELRLANKKEPW